MSTHERDWSDLADEHGAKHRQRLGENQPVSLNEAKRARGVAGQVLDKIASGVLQALDRFGFTIGGRQGQATP